MNTNSDHGGLLKPGCKIKVTGERGTFRKYAARAYSIGRATYLSTSMVSKDSGFPARERIQVVREKGGGR